MDLVAKFVKRIIEQYDNLISELEAVNEENKAFVNEANNDGDNPEIIQRMILARENLRRLDFAKVEKKSLENIYLKALINIPE